MKLPQFLTASGKLLTAVTIIVVVGYDMAKKMVGPAPDVDNPIKITKRWYTHTLAFGNTAATFCGPFLFNIFLQKVYNDPTTGEGMRLALATFGIPVLFWILSTVARFSCYSIAYYGSKEHCVQKSHYAHKAIFILQMVYSAYSRAMVIGMAGPTDLVGHSIGLRWGLIVSSLLTSIVAVLSRVTTQMRDRFMYKMWYCGRRVLPNDYFDHPGVKKFLSRDMLLLETFADIATLTGLSMFVMAIEIYLGVSAGDAFVSMLINWTIQVVFEQANNYVIFYLREKKNVFSSTFADETSTKIDNATKKGNAKTDTLPLVYRGTMNLLHSTVWFAFLAMPYVTFLIGFTLSGSLMRGLSLEYDVEDYPYVE